MEAIAQFSDQIKAARLGRDNALFLSRRRTTRRKFCCADTPELKNAVEIVPTGKEVSSKSSPPMRYVGDLLGGPSRSGALG
jgi:hypothetical protein